MLMGVEHYLQNDSAGAAGAGVIEEEKKDYDDDSANN